MNRCLYLSEINYNFNSEDEENIFVNTWEEARSTRAII